MATLSDRATTAPAASHPNALRVPLPFIAEMAAARNTPVAPVALPQVSSIVKQERNNDHTSTPFRNNAGRIIDLTESDNDDDNALVSAPAPACAFAPRRATPPNAVVIDSDDEQVVELPSPVASANRVILNANEGNIRASIFTWKSAAEMYWNLAKSLIYWLNGHNQGLGIFPIEQYNILVLKTMLLSFKDIHRNQANIRHMRQVEDSYQRLVNLCNQVRHHIRLYSTTNNSLDKLFRPDAPNELRTLYNQYTARGANLQIGAEMTVDEHYNGLFPILFKHNEEN